MTLVGAAVSPCAGRHRPAVSSVLQLPSLAQWLRADREASTVSGNVDQWNSPPGLSVAQASVPNRPTLMEPAGQRPYVRFNEGEFDLLSASFIGDAIGVNTWTLHVVCTVEGAGVEGIWGHTGGSAGDQLWLLGAGARYAGVALAWTQRGGLLVRTLGFDGTDVYYREHDATPTPERARAAATATSPPARPITIGVASTGYCTSSVYEVALYVPGLTPAQIAINEQRLSGRYGI